MKIRLVHPAIGEFSFPLVPGRAIIVGRAGPDVDVELNWDVRVSRRHAKLWVDNGRVFIEDLGSKNGTWRGNDRLFGPTKLETAAGALIGETLVSLPDEDALDLFLDDETKSGMEDSPLLAIPDLPTAPMLETAVAERTPRAGYVAPQPFPFPAPDREPAYLSTMDLRLQTSDLAIPTPRPPRIDAPITHIAPRPPTPGPAAVARPAAEGPRLPAGKFTAPDKVEIALSGPSEMSALWREHLARGGLFVETHEMRALYHRLEVTLVTPAGKLSFPATVVHASDPARAAELGVPPGLGLQATELTSAHKTAIQAYGEGLSPMLTMRPTAAQVDRTTDVDAASAIAKRVLEKLEKNDVYGAIDVPAEASDALVQERISTMASTLGAAAKVAPPHKAARIEAALLALGRLSQALGDPLRRLEHDLTRGFVRAEARLTAAKAGQGPTVSELRRVWQQVQPDKVDRAAFLTRKAFTAKQRGDLDDAIRSARAALEENPFFDELRPTLASWTKQQSERSSFAHDLPPPSRLRR